MKGETIAFAHGVKRTYAQYFVEYLAELYGKYYREKCFPPNALLLPCSMLVVLKAACPPGCSAFGNPYSDRFMGCEVVAIDERDCKEADYVPRFFRRSNPKDRNDAMLIPLNTEADTGAFHRAGRCGEVGE